jgi:hypothetical protein
MNINIDSRKNYKNKPYINMSINMALVLYIESHIYKLQIFN